MSRGSFGRTVARAAASGGSKSYRARPPLLWYVAMVVMVVAGVGLVVYSRYQKQHPAAAASASAPTTKDNWFAALSLDVCGKVQPALAANTNLSSAGIRTVGGGIVNIDPGAVPNSSKFTGKHATLGTFVKTYGHGFELTATSLRLPGATRTWRNGDSCPSSSPMPGKAAVRVMVWSSPTATGSVYTGDPAGLKLADGQMITVAFAPARAKLGVPAARSSLQQDLKGSG